VGGNGFSELRKGVLKQPVARKSRGVYGKGAGSTDLLNGLANEVLKLKKSKLIAVGF